jgi:hypothetical protein
MKRIDSSTVELTDIEGRFAGAHEAALDLGAGHLDACVEAWEVVGDYGWLPSPEFIEWLIGPTPSDETWVTDVLYLIHCEMQTCPDHGPVRHIEGDEVPSMAGGYDSYERWSCGCVVSTTPYSHSRQRPDGTYSDDCGGR